MSKKICIIFMIITSIILSATTVFGATFSDMGNHWSKEAVYDMASKGVINGFEDGTYRPNDPVTREQFAKILVEALDLKEANSSMKFEDVEDNRWSKGYIERASKYLTSYKINGKNYFKPTENAVREDIAVAVVMALGIQNGKADLSLLNQFSDKDEISENLRKYVAIAVENQIMKGKGGYFDPQGVLTRGEVAQLLYNIQEDKVVVEEETILGDINGNGEIDEEDVLLLYECFRGERNLSSDINKDINKDGKFNYSDVSKLYAMYTGKAIEDKVDETINTDINRDGTFNEKDVDTLYNYFRGKITLPSNVDKDINKDGKFNFLDVAKLYAILNGKAKENILLGDLNNDGRINKKDSVLLAQYLANWNVKINTKNADLNEDGKIDSTDSVLLAQHLEGIDVGLADPELAKPGSLLYGDVNADGKINMKDSILLAKYLASWNVNINTKNSDVNLDGKIDTIDAVELAQYLDGEVDTIVGTTGKVEEEKILYGDVNGDKNIDKTDLNLLAKFVVWRGDAEIDEKAADVFKTAENKIDKYDIILLNHYIYGKYVKEIPHTCKIKEERFISMNENEHRIHLICECGKINISSVQENHIMFADQCAVCDYEKHECVADKREYKKLDDKNHKIIELCICGEQVRELTEAHKFTNGKCVCGAEEHRCVASKTQYKELDDKYHNKIELCSCGKTVKTTKEAHKFANGKCTSCGAVEPKTIYKITIIQTNGGGITPEGTTTNVEEGKDITFKIKAEEGYVIKEIIITSEETNIEQNVIFDMPQPEEYTYTIENVNSAYTIEAKFIKKVPHAMPEEEIAVALLLGDINENGEIDEEDYNMLYDCFRGNLELPSYIEKDINQDGKFNYSDVSKLYAMVKGKVEEETILYGDVNDDGKVDNKDVKLLSQYLADWDVKINEAAADVWYDGDINISDSIHLQQYLEGMVDKLGK